MKSILKLFFLFAVVVTLIVAERAQAATLADDLQAQKYGLAFAREMNKAPLDPKFTKQILSGFRDSADIKYYGKKLAEWKLAKGDKFVVVYNEVLLVSKGQTVLRLARNTEGKKGILIDGEVFVWNPARPLRGELEKFFKNAEAKNVDDKKDAAFHLIDTVLPRAYAQMGRRTVLGAAAAVFAIGDALNLAEENRPLVERSEEEIKGTFPGRRLEWTTWIPAYKGKTSVQCSLRTRKATGRAVFGQTEVEYSSNADGSVMIWFEKDGVRRIYRLSEDPRHERTRQEVAAICSDFKSKHGKLRSDNWEFSQNCQNPRFNFLVSTCRTDDAVECKRASMNTLIGSGTSLAWFASIIAPEPLKDVEDNYKKQFPTPEELSRGYTTVRVADVDGIERIYQRKNEPADSSLQTLDEGALGTAWNAYEEKLSEVAFDLNNAFKVLQKLPECCEDPNTNPSENCPMQMMEKFGLEFKDSKVFPNIQRARVPRHNPASGTAPGGAVDRGN